jgi:hypothetical protein
VRSETRLSSGPPSGFWLRGLLAARALTLISHVTRESHCEFTFLTLRNSPQFAPDLSMIDGDRNRRNRIDHLLQAALKVDKTI